ncbi:YxlC family protein [Paenibacillus flagellatus]|uniref:YxlC family protein n=1 Tax=Paenibacillus flagellatus TaxID=2211139 RepID=A0A2V5JXN9_9BACL|nr:YxlC family protein [Paenibacillus flagellatus]PYI51625.1 hypothetical protein DLM86_24775 [Paenibacillus flagellatus]
MNHDERLSAEPIERALADELAKLDRLVQPTETPGPEWFDLFVEQGKRQARRKLVRDLTLFWLTAAGILAVYAALSFGRPMLFLAIQLAAVAVFPVVLLASGRRKKVTGRD